jgi:hypothetical protein
MLRITIHDHAGVTSFVVEANLVGPWVKELEKCWEGATAADPSRAMLVNLAGVKLIHSEGRGLLARLEKIAKMHDLAVCTPPRASIV